jgi:hypothetical protein
MDHLFDEFSKSLAESVPRRESLRRLGAVFAGAVLGPLGLGTAWARGTDPCLAFCKCSKKAQQSQCLQACRACSGNTSRIGGSCGSYTCCSIAACHGACSNLKSDPNCGACGHNCGALGETCCGNYCADLANDVFNCGRCGTACAAPPPYEYVACVSGACVYDCVPGADDCGDGTCTPLGFDPANCGACGNVCDESAPHCSWGTCSPCFGGQGLCDGVCVELSLDPSNCGGCGVTCGPGENCAGGLCQSAETSWDSGY